MRTALLAVCLFLITPITNTWWSVSGQNLALEPHRACKKARKLKGRLGEACRGGAALIAAVARGASLGGRECGHQFRDRRWNCTTDRRSLRRILMRDTRETGFVNAITAAGVTYAVTRACTAGELVDCSCDKKASRRHPQTGNTGRKNHRGKGKGLKRGRKQAILMPEGDWEWGGCGDNVHFGYRKSRDFMDSRPSGRHGDIKTLVRLHNNDAGRLAIKNHMRLECKCHGLSGSCTLKTCWMKMPPFRDVGNILKERFDGAAKVIAGNDGNSFMPEGPTIKTPSRSDLVYTENSPDFCTADRRTGSLGTKGRSCNATSPGMDGCDLLCCRRGYDRKIVRENVNCRCEFHWCCEVTCEVCQRKREVYTCR
uniref:Protein Wnt n=1 Tax=Xenopsylla cheopis TaxID=163159 RepID=A0A6M2DY21_XENCH